MKPERMIFVRRFVSMLILVFFVLSFAGSGLSESQTSFDEGILTDAGFTTKGDIFSGQVVYYMQDQEVTMLDYTTKVNMAGGFNYMIFGKSVKVEGELPAWTQGDSSNYHKKQSESKCYPCIVYNPTHAVPYSFVVALSLPPKSDWLGVQCPDSIMIATDNHIYTLKRYLPSSTGFYRDIVFFTMDESSMDMFYDMKGSGTLVVRATNAFGKSVDFPLRTPVVGTTGEGVDVSITWTDGIEDVIDAWELYVEAGGTSQDLTPYAGAIEVTER